MCIGVICGQLFSCVSVQIGPDHWPGEQRGERKVAEQITGKMLVPQSQPSFLDAVNDYLRTLK